MTTAVTEQDRSLSRRIRAVRTSRGLTLRFAYSRRPQKRRLVTVLAAIIAIILLVMLTAIIGLTVHLTGSFSQIVSHFRYVGRRARFLPVILVITGAAAMFGFIRRETVIRVRRGRFVLSG